MSSPADGGRGTPRGGLREAHAHVPMLGRAMSMLALRGCGSREECLELVRREAARGGVPGAPGAWVLGHGARVESWSEPRWPSLAELDDATAGRACYLMSFDHHAVLANSAALRAAGVRSDEPDPAGGVFVRDDAGRLTGLLLEAAAWRVWNAAPEPSAGERREHVRAGCRHLAALGFVEAHDLLSPAWLGPELAALADAGELPLRVGLFVPLDEVGAAVESAQVWQRAGVRLLGGKVFADGTLNSRTAWMLSDFRDPVPGKPRGVAMKTVAELTDAVRRTRALGLELAVHAIGDGAVRAVLDAVEEAGGAGSAADGRHVRIEHAEIIDERDVGRFAELGVVASVQPCHLLADVEALVRFVPQRLERVLPLRELIASGLEPGRTLIFGSDVPIVRAEPGDSIRAAVHRRREGAPESAAIAPGQAISEAEAWRCFGASVAG